MTTGVTSLTSSCIQLTKLRQLMKKPIKQTSRNQLLQTQLLKKKKMKRKKLPELKIFPKPLPNLMDGIKKIGMKLKNQRLQKKIQKVEKNQINQIKENPEDSEWNN